MEVQRGEYTISTDKTRLQPEVIHHYLSQESYWAKNIPMAVVQKAIAGSVCFGMYKGAAQIGFARVVTDGATIAYLADVFVLQEYRGQGLSKWLMETILAHPDLQGLRRFILATADAHGLYRQFGFQLMARPERWMERHDPDVYN